MGCDTLIIVESNGKCKKIEQLTGYSCVASFGHIYALKPSLKWFDVNSIEPEYIIPETKKKFVKELVSKAKSAQNVIIASDLDREGEAIAAHLMILLKLDPKKTQRITFNQITEKALKEALAIPGSLNEDLYHAQQARAVIDLVFGFTVSPFVSKHLNVRALSAGRCQSPTIRLCMERQREQQVGDTKIVASAQSSKFRKITHISPVISEESIEEWLSNVGNQVFVVDKVTKCERRETPPPPFITSSLQQVVYGRFSINPKQCMEIAQKLYEGGYITYMRTDSVVVSEQFQEDAVKWIEDKFGNDYCCNRQYSKKGDTKTQDAHEAIRPISVVKSDPSDPVYAKVYGLIRDRAIASQMSQAKYNETKISFKTNRNDTTNDNWETIEKVLVFDGFRILKNGLTGDDDESVLANESTSIKQGDIENISSICVKEQAQAPPTPYNPASLVKMLEKTGIGRPSTYSSIIDRIQDKGYVRIGTNPKLDVELREWKLKKTNKSKLSKNKYTQKIGGQSKVFIVTELGIRCCEFLEKSSIENIVNTTFTSDLENDLDRVASGDMNWKVLVKRFHTELTSKLKSQPTPQKTYDKNWERMLKSENGNTIGLLRTQYGMSIVSECNNKCVYASLPPSTSPEEITLEEAETMLSLPITISDTIELKIGRYGWYATDGKRNVALGTERELPKKTNIIEAFSKKPDCEIIEKISDVWTLRRKKESYYLMYNKGKKPSFYSVKDISGKWTVSRCDEYRKKNIS